MEPHRAIIWAAVSTKPQAIEDEKISLPRQETDARALCEREGWHIVDILRIPGHSRRYIDIHECAADMQAQGIDAFTRLLDHWQRSDFDILIVRDGDRFARTQTLHAYVTEQTIDIGARIYSLSDGWVDEKNYRLWIAMGGYRAASDIDRLVEARTAAMDFRASRGLPTSSWVFFPYKVERDDRGRVLRMVVDESKRRLWDDLATLYLEGVGWHDLERELYKRFGHADSDGKPFRPVYFYNVLNNPTFWGNSARHWFTKTSRKTDMWIFDPSVPAPDGVKIWYDTHEPVYTGELAERMKAEMRRRRSSIRGSNRPYRNYMFSGLLLCAECNYYMVVTHKNKYTGLYCASKDPANYRNPDRPICSQRRQINEIAVQAYIDELLRMLLNAGTLEIFDDNDDTNIHKQQQIVNLEHELSGLENNLGEMIRNQAAVGDDLDLKRFYDHEIQKVNERRKIIQQHLDTLRRENLNHTEITQSREIVMDELREMTLETFWKQPPTAINQMLHRLFGKKRLTVLEAEIIGFTDAPVRIQGKFRKVE